MFSKALLFTLANALLALAGPEPAATVTNNPNDVVLRADFPAGNSQTVVGVIQFYSLNGIVKVHVDITGLPKNSGMFSYHIHDQPLINPDSTCEETGDHFNPFNSVGLCDSLENDSFCEIGDLSGKHGLINTTCFETFYLDPYLSLDPSHPQYIGNKAINIHLIDQNDERLACANIRRSKEPEDLLLLNPETERREVRKYEELSGVETEEYDVPDKDQEYDSSSPSEVIEDDNKNHLDGTDFEEVYEEVVVENAEEQDEEDVTGELHGESLAFGQESPSGEDVSKDAVTPKAGNLTSFNTSNTSGSDENEESGAVRLHLQAVFGFIFAVFLALLI